MPSKRLLSLDAFRGFTIAAMILVNYPGSWDHVYPPLMHAHWNGMTPTDLIFPFFLFIVGVSISLSMTKVLEKGIPKKALYGKILFRTFKIFLVGVLLDYIHHFDFEQLRIAGVLQRIAIVFLICSFLFLNSSWKAQLWTAIIILISYWLMMTLIPTPGYETAMLEPGVNLAAWVDSKVMPGRLFQGTWDPEGLLSTLPAVASGVMGILTGHVLRTDHSEDRRTINLFSLGAMAAIVGYLWSLTFPINKNLWTSSYVLVSGGLAMMLLAISIYRVDTMKKEKVARIGIIFGSNAITVYVLADVLAILLYEYQIDGKGLGAHFVALSEGGSLPPELLSAIYAFSYVALLFVPCWWMYRKKIFIKL